MHQYLLLCKISQEIDKTIYPVHMHSGPIAGTGRKNKSHMDDRIKAQYGTKSFEVVAPKAVATFNTDGSGFLIKSIRTVRMSTLNIAERFNHYPSYPEANAYACGREARKGY